MHKYIILKLYLKNTSYFIILATLFICNNSISMNTNSRKNQELLNLCQDKNHNDISLEIIKKSIKANFLNANYINSNSKTLINIMCSNENCYYSEEKYKIIEYLLTLAKPEYINIVEKSESNTPLHYTVYYNDIKTSKLLIDNKANVKSYNKLGRSPLYMACFNGNYDISEYILRKGNLVDARYINFQEKKYGCAAIHLACYSGNLKLIKLLIQYGANYKIKSNDGSTPRDIAKNFKKTEIIAYFDELDKQVINQNNNIIINKPKNNNPGFLNNSPKIDCSVYSKEPESSNDYQKTQEPIDSIKLNQEESTKEFNAFIDNISYSLKDENYDGTSFEEDLELKNDLYGAYANYLANKRLENLKNDYIQKESKEFMDIDE